MPVPIPTTDYSVKILKFHGVRALRIWEIVALSLGQPPYKNRLKARQQQDRQFKRMYLDRIRTIGSKIHSSPMDGLVLHLVNHPKDNSADTVAEYIVDSLSALQVLRKHAYKIPEEMNAFELSIVSEPCPPGWHSELPQVLPGPPSEPPKPIRDQTATTASAFQNNLQRLVIGLLELYLGEPVTDATNFDRLAKDLEGTFKDRGISAGIGWYALSTQLKRAQKVDR